ncbi:PaaI family thioesterase [Geodermatophilus sp. SYSU D00814]
MSTETDPVADPLADPVPASWGEPRSRTVTWYDPMLTAAGGRERSGLETMEAVRDGVLPPPPISELVQMDVVAVEEGRVEFSCAVDESVYNPIGVVHGGLVCTLLDSVTGCAVHTTLPRGVGYTSIEIKVTYQRAVTRDSGPLTAVGTVVKPGRRVAFAEGQVLDAAGRVVATASSSLLVFPLPD